MCGFSQHYEYRYQTGVTGIAPHPSDYYEITADLDMAQ